QTHAPDWPYRLKVNGDFISGPGLPLNTSIAIRLPWLRSNSGLGSKRSNALGAPSMNSQITDFALGVKCGARVGVARSLGDSAALVSAGAYSKSARASIPRPPPARARNCRLVTGRA